MRKFTSFSDESGMIKKKFIVATAIVDNDKREKFEQTLAKIEEESGKKKKWTDVGLEIRKRYGKLLLREGVFTLCTVYYGIYFTKAEYVTLVGAQIAKSILKYADNKEYKATIFLDKVNKKTTEKLHRELKQYKIRHRKIRGLDDTNNVGLKFVDAMCGLVRDMQNKNIDSCYKTIFNKLRPTS